MAKDEVGLFEDERDADGQLVLSEIGLRFKQIANHSATFPTDTSARRACAGPARFSRLSQHGLKNLLHRLHTPPNS
jgi:hypothetical protein